MEQDHKVQTNQFSANLLDPHELTEKNISAWKYLESRAIEANAYLSPNFVIPAIRHLENNSKTYILTVNKNNSGSSDLAGVFIFKVRKFSKLFPLPHLSAFHSRHSFLSGILVDKDHAPDVVKIIFDYLSNSSLKWHGIAFEDHPVEGPLAEIENNITSQMGMKWLPFIQWDRGILYPPSLKENSINSLSKNIRKNYRRGMRGLRGIGEVDWEIVQGDELTSVNIDNFMMLENMGWKGDRKSSIYSHPNYVSFFREMIENFNKDGRAFFTELRLNDQVVSSTSNLISGDAGFAFKSGWNLAYAKYSLGILNRLTLMESKENIFKQLKYIDSGSPKESYINYIWPEKRQMQSGIFIRSNIGKLIMPCLQFGLYPGFRFAQNLKHRFVSYKRHQINWKAQNKPQSS
jgi:hypothetical protein